MATKVQEKTKLSVIYDFFKQFPKWCGKQAVTPTVSDMEKYFAANMQMFNNGKLVAKGPASYLDRLQKFQKKYADFQISQPLEEPILSENRGVLYYKLDLTAHNGQHKQIYIMGMFTLDHEKISKWVEVTSEKDAAAASWDA